MGQTRKFLLSRDFARTHTNHSLTSVLATRYTRKQEAEAAASPMSLSSQNAHASGSTFSFLKSALGKSREISGLHPFHGAPTGTRDPQRTKSTLHFPQSCFHKIDDCAFIVDGPQFHRNQHREAGRVRSYSRDRSVITNELTSFSPILMTLRAEKVVSSARS